MWYLMFVKGQSSFEFLLLISFVLAAFGLGLFFVFDYFNDSVDDFKASRLEQIGRNLVETSEVLSVRGAGSRTSFNFEAPVDIVDFSNFGEDLFLIEYLEGGDLKNFSILLKFDVRFFGSFNFGEGSPGMVSLETYDFGEDVFVVATPFSRCEPNSFDPSNFDTSELTDIDLSMCSDVSRSNPGSNLEWFDNLCFYFDSDNDCSLNGSEITRGETILSSLPVAVTTPKDLFDIRNNLNGNYFLTDDIDLSGFDNDNSANNGNWVPIGNSSNPFTGSLDGNGFSITGLNINVSSQQNVGLFGKINGVNISNVSVFGSVSNTRLNAVGGLVGDVDNSNISYASFSGDVSSGSGSWYTGGLIGDIRNSSITSSFASGSVTGGGSYTGGLVGIMNGNSRISSSFASSNVDGRLNTGGLVGGMGGSSSISSSFSFGSVNGSGNRVGGFVGSGDHHTTCSSDSYWNTETSGRSSSACGAVAKTTSELQTPTSNTGIYDNWNPNIWDFGTSSEYPSLILPSLESPSVSTYSASGSPFGGGSGTVDEPFIVVTGKHLNNVKTNLSAHYVLVEDVDLSGFDNDDNAGNGNWDPIGSFSDPFTGSLDGKGFSITGLNINVSFSQNVGLFGSVSGASISNVSVAGFVNSIYNGYAGSLIGTADNSNISHVSFSGDVNGNSGSVIGGLIGTLRGNSEVSNSFASGSVSGRSSIGGLIGFLRDNSEVYDSFASSNVNGYSGTGGLVGTTSHSSSISDSFSFGVVVGSGGGVGGLVGYKYGSSTCVNSYWDNQTSGQSSSACGVGNTTSQLQTPTSNTGIYANWNPNIWDFGTSTEYPTLIRVG